MLGFFCDINSGYIQSDQENYQWKKMAVNDF